MIINGLYLSDFRNYVEQTVRFSDGLNVFCGPNAEGKTNLLEAVYLFGVGRSPRTTKDRDLIRWNAPSAYVRAETQKKFSTHKIEIMLDRSDKKRIAIDSMPIGKIGELMGALSVVLFSPDELRLVKASPVERRRFMDISLCQQNKAYFYTLQRYNKILEQRNTLLKTANDLSTLQVWDSQLAKEGAKIIEYRFDFANKIKSLAQNSHDNLTNGKEVLETEYESECENDGNIEEKLLSLLSENFEKDKKLTFTSVGPHREDLRLTVNGTDVRKFGSQGQQRTVALSLKLAETELFKINTGEYPVLLLDDVLSELDEERRLALLESVKHLQTVLTCTEFEQKNAEAKIFRVKQGKIFY